MQYKPFTLNNFRDIPQTEALSPQQIRDIKVVGTVLPFRTNNYVVDNLINWECTETDPLYTITFPQKGMLAPEDYDRIDALLRAGADKEAIQETVTEVRGRLNPHPAGQMDLNVPVLNGENLSGIQHKYRETVLFFPSQGQTCHAYCTFCFRWPQFVRGMEDLKMASREIDTLVEYVRSRPEVTDVLITGGDPLVMKTCLLAGYIEPLLSLPGIKTIRLGTRSLSFWPHRFVTDDDAEELLALFRRVGEAGKHLSFMAHFNHPVELVPDIAREAVRRIRATGAVIRAQSPLLRHINDSAALWADMWRRQVDLGCVPYYMFMARDTGAQRYFSVPLDEAWCIYQGAYQSISGICRTGEGPVMSALPGKVQVMGTAIIASEKVFVLRMVQGRNPDWVNRPFFAAFDETAIWFDDVLPAFGEKEFFFEEELEALLESGETESDF